MGKPNSRWHAASKPGIFFAVSRLHRDRTVEDSRQVRDRHGIFRTVRDAPDEVKWCERRREGFGWRNGARIARAA